MSTLAGRIRRVPGWQWTFAVALLALGFLIAVQLGAEGPRVRYSSSERPPLLETARELDAAQAALQARILELRGQIAAAEAASAGTDQAVMKLNDDLTEARMAAGLVEIEGPGLIVRIDDSGQPVPPGEAAADYLVTASDLRDLVVELWQAGAEAISVNGERLVETTAFTDIGSSVLVNSAYLQPPYDVSVIGPAELYDRLDDLAELHRPGPLARAGLRPRARLPALGPRRRGGLRGHRQARPGAPGAERVAGQRGRTGRICGAGRAMKQPRALIVVTTVAFVLGILLVMQLRAQNSAGGLEQLSAADLTVLIANLNDRNGLLRAQVGELEADLRGLEASGASGEGNVDRLRSDLTRLRLWAGLEAIEGRGIIVVSLGRSRPMPSMTCSMSCASPAPRRSRSRTSVSWLARRSPASRQA